MKIKELLDKQEKWTKGAMARDKNGQSVASYHKKAICWCLNGALNHCYPFKTSKERIIYDQVYQKIIAWILKHSQTAKSIPVYNDRHATFADIQAMGNELDI